MNNIIGTTVFHKTFGKGQIVSLQGKYITIDFNGCCKKFVYPYSMNVFLFTREEWEKEQKIKLFYDAKNRDVIIEQIKRIVGFRNIKFLLHFTSIDNLKSILKNGILSREEMKKKMIKATVNDELRLDFRPNGISCSISLPNAPLLFKFRKTYPDRQYVILKLKPDLLWEKQCLFCKENAASNNIHLDLGAQKPEALEQMFGDYDKMHTRADLEKLYADGFIKQNMPTHNQAEVLVMGKIEPEYITGMYFFKDDVSIPFRDKLSEIFKEEPEDDFSFECVPDDFMRRCKNPEKAFWQNTKSVQMEVHQDTTSSFDDEIPF